MQNQLTIIAVFLVAVNVLLHQDAKSASSYNYVLQYDNYVGQQWWLFRDRESQPLANIEIGFLITEENGTETIRMTLAMKSLLPNTQHLLLTGFEGPTDVLVEQLKTRNQELRTNLASPANIKSFFQTREVENILIPTWPINEVFEIHDTQAHHFNFMLNPEYESQSFTLTINLYPSRITALLPGFNPIEVTITLPERKTSPLAQRAEETDVQQTEHSEEPIAAEPPSKPQSPRETTRPSPAESPSVQQSPAREPFVFQEPSPRTSASGEQPQLGDLVTRAASLYQYVFFLSGNDGFLTTSKATLDSCSVVIDQIKTDFDQLSPHINTSDFTVRKKTEEFDDYYNSIISALTSLENRLAEQKKAEAEALVNNRPVGEKIIKPVEQFVARNTELFISAGLLLASLIFILFVSLKKTKNKPQPKAVRVREHTKPSKRKKKKEKSHYELKREMYLSGKQSDTIKI